MTEKKVLKSVTLPLTGYRLTGFAVINSWGSLRGEIKMNMSCLEKEVNISKKNLAQFINDGGFGCESIESANMTVEARYERSHFVTVRRYHYNKEEIPMNCKRGI